MTTNQSSAPRQDSVSQALAARLALAAEPAGGQVNRIIHLVRNEERARNDQESNIR